MNEQTSEEIVIDENIHLIPSKKFKTINVIVKFKAHLDRDTITRRAILPYVLQRGTINYPTEQKLNVKLDELYGAIFSINGAKKGDNHMITFRLEVANEKYIADASIFTDALQLLKELIFEPHVEDGIFPERTVEREKTTLKNKINAIKDDKIQYANMRLIDEMCNGERYAVRTHGYEADLPTLTADELYNYYQKMLQEDRIDIYVIGDIDVETVGKQMKETFPVTRQNKAINLLERERVEQKEMNEVIETEEIDQAKLHIGYRTNCTYEDSDYFALQVFNGLFGGFPSSKLFMNVREKHSLAYYVGSRVESHKGLLIVLSGIAPAKYEKTKTIIGEQFQAIIDGEFTEAEIKATQELIVSQLLETEDSALGTVELLYNQVIANKQLPTKTYIEQIQAVTKEDIVRVANNITLDTIYLLTEESTGDADE